MSDLIDDDEHGQNNFLSDLRTKIILAARKSSSSSDIDIAAIDKVVEITFDFVKNLLEQMVQDTTSTSLSSFDLFNTLRLNPHLIPNRTLYFAILETINHS